MQPAEGSQLELRHESSGYRSPVRLSRKATDRREPLVDDGFEGRCQEDRLPRRPIRRNGGK